ncbi:MAG: hypothetical protein BAA01_04125 [Bacillus thermozeamaize]|uniref:Transposase n=1 Tax=Bacillus thermozeamaize TaxID=230954 RepID=A0A1Y3PLL5_9BACI|nr:MAG: hypothetical protein BAA01_04125 [Bacillus thermozeamaize]
MIVANQKPDNVTNARFRKTHEAALSALFTESLKLSRETGLLRVGTVVLDGTKIKAAASLSANRTDDPIEREVQKILQEAEAVDRAEDERYGPLVRGEELPKDLHRRNDRLAGLKAAKVRLEEEAKLPPSTPRRKPT